MRTRNLAEVLDPFLAGRKRLTEFLIGYSLIESYFAFARHKRAYPFVPKHAVVPGTILPTAEHRYQNTAFIILLDGSLPEGMIKHFRLRGSNRITSINLKRFSPGTSFGEIGEQDLDVISTESEMLLRRLMPLDYAVVAQRLGDDPLPVLSHAHVKIERLMDNALRELALDLGYIERRLFERGEDYADVLEGKYYEYYGFPSNSSGRKSAAAMAAQLLAKSGFRFSVLLANQDDCRITTLDEGERVTQYMLARLNQADAMRLTLAAQMAGSADAEPYIVARDGRNGPIVVYRVDLIRTTCACGHVRSDADRLLRQPWLAVGDEWVVRLPTGTDDEPPSDVVPELLPFAWTGQGDIER